MDSLIHPIYFYLPNFILHPYVRMTRRSKYFGSARKYLSNRTEFRTLLQDHLDRVPRFISESGFYLPENRHFQTVLFVNTLKDDNHCDLDNLVKSALDGAQGVVFKDDRNCDSITAVRAHNYFPENLVLLAFCMLLHNPQRILSTLLKFPPNPNITDINSKKKVKIGVPTNV